MTELGRRAALAALAGAGLAFGPRPATAQQRVLLRGAGSSFAAPLFARWIKAVEAARPGLSIVYDSVGSGEGISRFVTGSGDFAATDAVPSDAQLAKVADGARMVPATAGMVVLAYNLPGVRATLRLPRAVLPAILRGEIRSWNDPAIVAANPGLDLPKRTIVLVARLDGSGTTYALTNHLAAIDPVWRERHGVATRVDWPGTAMLMRGNEGVSGRLRVTEGGLGYVEHGFAKRLGLPMAELENREGRFVAPTAAAGREALASADVKGEDLRIVIPDPPGAGSYPIVSYTWLLLYGRYTSGAKLEGLRAFAEFGLGDGQQIAAEMGYVPLPESVAAASRSALQLIG
ncbi:MAG: phosphate ABC transporter substrate-binding protein PstS [Geminicoccaceae bacterium]|nr:phosphate ABC transporter substrate-binding protein PstS [Geminicoccaceae bacterium]